jgi:hypothetical protein
MAMYEHVTIAERRAERRARNEAILNAAATNIIEVECVEVDSRQKMLTPTDLDKEGAVNVGYADQFHGQAG